MEELFVHKDKLKISLDSLKILTGKFKFLLPKLSHWRIQCDVQAVFVVNRIIRIMYSLQYTYV